MTSKIEVPRELLQDLISYADKGKVAEPYMADQLRELLAAPLSPDHSGGGAGVVLPEDKPEVRAWGHDMGGNYAEGHADGWNACLDKVKELNQ